MRQCNTCLTNLHAQLSAVSNSFLFFFVSFYTFYTLYSHFIFMLISSDREIYHSPLIRIQNRRRVFCAGFVCLEAMQAWHGFLFKICQPCTCKHGTASGLCPWYHIIRHHDLQAAVSAESIDIRVIHDLQALSALHFLIKPLCFPEINAAELSPCLVR